MEITSISTSSVTSGQASTIASGNAADFAAELAVSVSQAGALSAAQGKADFVSGRIGLDLNERGVPSAVIYFDESGNKLRASIFTAESILKYTDKFGIDLQDLAGLGEQLDAAGVGFRPYELYKGTGSDHGVDFNDLIAGGMGSAYDWTQDANVQEKGARGLAHLEAAQALASALGVEKHAEVTHDQGIDPAYFEPLGGRGETPRNYVLFNGQLASWYRTVSDAQSAVSLYGGGVIDVSRNGPSSTPIGSRGAGQQLLALVQASPKTIEGSAQAVLDALLASRGQ